MTTTATPQNQDLARLVETTYSGSVQVDRAAHVIRGVKIVGLHSPARNRVYLDAALRRAVALYEGTKVNLNHHRPRSPEDFRPLEDRIGRLSDAHFREGEGIFADLAFNPQHPFADTLVWWAEHDSDAIGLSHDALGRETRRGTVRVVESIERVNSVDLVADPATNRGLFESDTAQNDAATPAPADLSHLDVATLRAARPDLVAAILHESQAELDRFRASEALAEKHRRIDALIEEARLPCDLVTDVFRRALLEARDDAHLRELIADRAALARAGTSPQSREQLLVESAANRPLADARSFAQSITVRR